MTMARPLLLLLTVTFIFITAKGQPAGTSDPTLLTYNELVALYETDPPSPELAKKLTSLLNTPFVNNSAGTRAARSEFLRVATWNIERGLEFDAVKAALTNDQRFFSRLRPTLRGSRFNLESILEQAAELSRA